MSILAPISAGELVDKITILRVKAQRIDDPAKEANVRKELALLEATARQHLPDTAEIARLTEELTAVNAALWDIEDGKRDCERRQDFGPDFVALARAFGWQARRVSERAELDEALAEFERSGGPFFLDVAVAAQENCFPMIPAGAAHHEIWLGEGRRWDDAPSRS